MCLYLHLARARAKLKYDVGTSQHREFPIPVPHTSCCPIKKTLSSKAVLFFIGRLHNTTGFDGYKTGKAWRHKVH